MNETIVDDLKQFFTAALSEGLSGVNQQIQKLDGRIEGLDSVLNGKIDDLHNKLSSSIDDLHNKLRGRIDDLDSKLNGRIDDLSAAIALALDVSNEVTGEQYLNHERRISRLEHKRV